MRDCKRCIYWQVHTEYRPDEEWQDMTKYCQNEWRTWIPSGEICGCIHGGNCHGAKRRGEHDADD